MRAGQFRELRATVDQPTPATPDFSTKIRRFRSSVGGDLGLQSEIAICYQRQVFSCGQVGDVAAGVLQKGL
jgi:hypothetical protein